MDTVRGSVWRPVSALAYPDLRFHAKILSWIRLIPLTNAARTADTGGRGREELCV